MATTRVYWLHTLTPTHVGTGRGIGYIDLPIDRDTVTNWPIIRGSAFKGVWADRFRATDDERRTNPRLRAAFGRSSDSDNQANAGALIPTDAKLVCLPVRSFRGTFAWCTSHLALTMLKRTLELAGARDLPPLPEAKPDAAGPALVTDSTALTENQQVYFEDLDFKAEKSPAVTAWAQRIAGWVFPDDTTWQTEFVKRFTVLPDAVFDFLTETGTEVSARVRIDDATKTVAEGALWNEESLPAETILAGLVMCDRVYEAGVAKEGGELLAKFTQDQTTNKPEFHLQMGGKATVGRGQVRCVFSTMNGGAK